MDNFIKTYPGALSAERCEYFIDFFEKEDSLGHTHIGQSGSGVNQKRKNSTDLNVFYNHSIDQQLPTKSNPLPKIDHSAYRSEEHLENLQSYHDIVFDKFEEYILGYMPGDDDYSEFFEETGSLFIKDFRELWELNSPGGLMHRYEPPAGGFMRWHQDWTSPAPHKSPSVSMRMLVGMIYLNDVLVGGETEFYNQKVKLKPQQGMLVIFPAYFTHMHRGLSPVSNTKYVINQWALPKV